MYLFGGGLLGALILFWIISSMLSNHADRITRRIDEDARQRERERQLREFDSRPSKGEETHHREPQRVISDAEWERMRREDEENEKARQHLNEMAEASRKRAIAFKRYSSVLEIEKQHEQQKWSRIWANTDFADRHPFLHHAAEEALRAKLTRMETIRSLLHGMPSDDKVLFLYYVLNIPNAMVPQEGLHPEVLNAVRAYQREEHLCAWPASA